jgi:hypothetical protein
MKNRSLEKINKFLNEKNYLEACAEYIQMLKLASCSYRPMLLGYFYTAARIIYEKPSFPTTSGVLINDEVHYFLAPILDQLSAYQVQGQLIDSASSLAQRTATLAASPLLDVPFLEHQLDVSLPTPAVAALAYYSSNRADISPNPLFKPGFYRFKNRLPHDQDSVTHYLASHSPNHFHPYFDADHYRKIYPESQNYNGGIIRHYLDRVRAQQYFPLRSNSAGVDEEILNAYLSGDAVTREFNLSIYREFSPDLSVYSDNELRAHYSEYGMREGRIGTLSALLDSAGADKRYIPVDFNPDTYAEINADLGPQRSTKWVLLWHYLKNGLKEGRSYSWEYLWVPAVSSEPDLESRQNNVDTSDVNTSLCILAHLYYPDTWDEIRGYIANAGANTDLYVNLVDSTFTAEVITKIRSDFPAAMVYISENHGRDIGGFCRLAEISRKKTYLAYVLVHGKKSPHVSEQYVKRWKKNLLNAILGSEQRVKKNVEIMSLDEQVGIIASAYHRHTEIGANDNLFAKALSIYQIDQENAAVEYVSGTMMMVRSEVMLKIVEHANDLEWENGDDLQLDKHIDGQWAHAIERIFGNVMKQQGYKFYWTE